jgi:hypothetical protein
MEPPRVTIDKNASRTSRVRRSEAFVHGHVRARWAGGGSNRSASCGVALRKRFRLLKRVERSPERMLPGSLADV